jgi:biotin carboxyl carrier protein
MLFHLRSGESEIVVQKQDHQILTDGKPVDFEVLEMGRDSIRLKLKNKIYHLDIVKKGDEESGWRLKINGKEAEVTLKTELDLLMEKLGGSSAQAGGARQIKAPMPGLIVKLVAQVGDTVSKGQILLNFEAMKMENQLKSSGNGRIKAILVKPGDKVEKGQILVELE